MVTVTTYEYNPSQEVTCVDEGNDGRSNSISLERGLVPQDNCTIITVNCILSAHGALVVCIRLKHLKTKTGQRTDNENQDGSRNVSSLFIQPPNAAASHRKIYGVQRNAPIFHTLRKSYNNCKSFTLGLPYVFLRQ